MDNPFLSVLRYMVSLLMKIICFLVRKIFIFAITNNTSFCSNKSEVIPTKIRQTAEAT